MSQTPRRLAIVLFNLGGPDRPEAVRPFLFNLFNDPAIIRLPWPLRPLLATLISRRRAKAATAIYEELGGGSPLLENTRAQAAALEAALREQAGAEAVEARCFIAMRYWHPMAMETAQAVKDWAPDQIVLLPLYPQFSTTTTASSARVWREAAKAVGLAAPESLVCCYPIDAGFVEAMAALIAPRYRAARQAAGRARILFSAHGLPEKIVKAGDPYQWQCERTNEAIVARLSDLVDEPAPDWVNCYQSRVGPLAWIGPSTEAEVARAGADQVGCVVVPMAFVSEHSETLVELDIEYRDLAREKGVPAYERVPTVAADAGFIAGLARLALAGTTRSGTASMTGGRLCPADWSGCPCRTA